MRTSSRPSEASRARSRRWRREAASPRKARSHSSIASHRSSSGVRFHRSHLRQTTQSRPFAASNARRRPTGKCSTASLWPRSLLQKRQVRYMSDRTSAQLAEFRPAQERPDAVGRHEQRPSSKIAAATPSTWATTPPVNAPTTCDSPTTTNPYAAMMRPRSASGTMPLERPVRDRAVEDHRRCRWRRAARIRPTARASSENAIRSARPEHRRHGQQSACARSRSPTAARPSAPHSPPMPRKESSSP